MEKIFETKFGEITFRTAMLDVNGTDLVSGIEIKLEGELVGEELGSLDIEELTIEEVENLVERYIH